MSNEIEFEDLMNKGTSEYSYADIQWLKGYAHTFYLKLEELEALNKANYLSFIDANKKLQQKENIIKEAREYIKDHTKEWIHDDYDVTLYYALLQNECDELLEILDKANDREDK